LKRYTEKLFNEENVWDKDAACERQRSSEELTCIRTDEILAIR